jgi:hypothetical protein
MDHSSSTQLPTNTNTDPSENNVNVVINTNVIDANVIDANVIDIGASALDASALDASALDASASANANANIPFPSSCHNKFKPGVINEDEGKNVLI